MTRAPVIPVGLWGTDEVWPRSAALPSFNLQEPKVTTVGPPVDLKYRSVERDTERIMHVLSALLPSGTAAVRPDAGGTRSHVPGRQGRRPRLHGSLGDDERHVSDDFEPTMSAEEALMAHRRRPVARSQRHLLAPSTDPWTSTFSGRKVAAGILHARLVERVVDTARPIEALRWEIDPDFDLTNHVVEVAVRHPAIAGRCSTSPPRST